MRSLSIIIPAYNEESRLPSTLDRIVEYVRTKEWSFIEILVVDDGSRDGTAEFVKKYRSRAAIVELLSNPGNRGKGYAVRHGMLKAKGDWRLFTDSDLSAPIEELDRLFQSADEKKAQIAIGSRAIDSSYIMVHQPLSREISGRLFNLIMRLATGLPYRDTQCGFKLYHADAAKTVFSRQKLDGFGFDVEDVFIAKLKGIPAVEVPVRWANVEGTRVSMAAGVKAFWDLVVIRWNQVLGRYR